MVDQVQGFKEGIVEEFNSLGSESQATIALSKRDIELLINSLAELHQSYASLLQWRIVTDFQPPGLSEETEQLAAKSYGHFQQLAQSLMSRFIEAERK